MPIETRVIPTYRPITGRRMERQVEVSLGSIRRSARNVTEAKRELMEAVERQCDHAYTRRYLRHEQVTFVLYYADGWCYDIVVGDGRSSCSTGYGSDITEHKAMDRMRAHFEQYIEQFQA